MAEESKFVAVAFATAQSILVEPLSIQQGKALLYEITVDNNLEITVNPKRPMRGDSAFQTDLCIFETKSAEVVIPRVVLEFKTNLTTHDIITYSAKARKHKQVYPYLRYGLIASDMLHVPKRFFVHNEALDFCATLADVRDQHLANFFAELINVEVEASELLEEVAFGKAKPKLFRNKIILDLEVTRN
jgi:hypothetical protein